jgi:FkbM family methyltransferase
MKKIFLDCGTHFGQGLDYFIRRFNIDESWHVETYEANPITYNKHKPNRKYDFVQYKNLAVTNYDGIIELNIECPAYPHTPDTGMATSIISRDVWNPQNGKLIFNKKVNIDCIDLSKYLKNNFNCNDFVLCKLDVEGSEYEILNKLIFDETIDYINILFVEFHCSYFKNKEEILKIELLIKDNISKRNKTKLYEWQ